MSRALRVGIVGASAKRGWAKESHVPAVQNLAGLELIAVATGSQPSADEAAKAFGAKRAYGRAEDLVRDPDIDLVAIAVKVPDHRQLVFSALASGKHVYCEWPLGRNVAEAQEMAHAASIAGVHAAIGLQTRSSPALHRASDLIESGAIGHVLTARLYSGTIAFGPKMGTADLYLEDAENGATLIAIHGGHALDVAMAALGPLDDLSALATTQYPEIQVGDEAARRPRSIPDHLLLQARLASGGALSIEVAGGRPPGATPFRLDIVGDGGDLALYGGAPRGFQSGRLRLSLNGKPQEMDEGETGSLPDTAANVAGLYAALRDDISNQTWTAPSFDHALFLTRLLDDATVSARTGARTPAGTGPTTNARSHHI